MSTADSNASGRKKKLKITEESLRSVETDSLVNKLEEAKKVPLVREVGSPEKTGGTARAIGWMLGAGVAGGIATWVIWRATAPIFEDDEEATASNIFSSVTLAVVIGLVLVVGDVIRAGETSKLPRRLGIGVGSALVAGLVLGFFADNLYSSGVDQIVDDLLSSGLNPVDDAFWDEFLQRNQLNRGIAWSFIGLAAGITVGASSLQLKRVAITGAGGLVGGFIGGYLFDTLPVEGAAQITGLLITGMAMGGVIALTEQAVKAAWVEITHGGMAGKQFILYQNSVTLGSSPGADITLIKDASIPPSAFTIETKGNVRSVSSLDTTAPLFVNGLETSHAVVRDGDSISIGGTALKYRERGNTAVKSGVVRS